MGERGSGAKRRGFEASAFNPECVPRWVNVIKVVTDPSTGKRYFQYIDLPGNNGPDRELLYLFGVSTDMSAKVQATEERAAKAEAELVAYKALPWYKKILVNRRSPVCSAELL